MTPARAGLFGLAVVSLHAAALPFALDHFARPALSVRVPSGPIFAGDGRPHLDARLPPGLAGVAWRLDDRPLLPAALADQVLSPGLHRAEWRVDYRGGFTRKVGVTVLAGPFQDQAPPACTGRLLLGQRFLDETLAPLARSVLDTNLEGFGHWTIGDFHYVRELAMTWRGPTPLGPAHLEIHIVLSFNRAEVPIWIQLVPAVEKGRLRITSRVFAYADLDSTAVRVGARLLSFLHIFDKDDEADREVTRQLKPVLEVLESLTAPPGVVLCDGEAVAIVPGSASVPLRLDVADAGRTAVHLARGEAPPLAPSTAPLAVEADLDTLNLLLDHLWRDGTLDRVVAGAAAEAWNLHPSVRQLLTLRIAGAHVSLPPVVERQGGPGRLLTLGGELAVSLRDDQAGRTVPARLFARVGFDLAGEGPHVNVALSPEELAGSLDASAALSCEESPGVLTPCFADILDAVLGRVRVERQALHGRLVAELARVFDEVVRGYRFELAGHAITVEPWRVLTAPDGDSARVRVELRSRAD